MAKGGESCNRCPRLKIVAKALNPIDKAWWWAGWNRMEIIARRFRDLVWSQLHEMDFFLLTLPYSRICENPVSIVVWLYHLYLVPNELVRFLLHRASSSYRHLKIRQGVLGVGWWDVECEDDVPPWNEVLRAVSSIWCIVAWFSFC